MDQALRKTVRNNEEKRIIQNRIKRIKGQIVGIENMINDDSYCNDLLIQIIAAEKSLKSLANVILEHHLYRCISNDLENGEYESIDEIISLFKRFND